MKKKPKKWDYKVWVLAGHSGYMRGFQFAGDTLAEGVIDQLLKKVGKRRIS